MSFVEPKLQCKCTGRSPSGAMKMEAGGPRAYVLTGKELTGQGAGSRAGKST